MNITEAFKATVATSQTRKVVTTDGTAAATLKKALTSERDRIHGILARQRPSLLERAQGGDIYAERTLKAAAASGDLAAFDAGTVDGIPTAEQFRSVFGQAPLVQGQTLEQRLAQLEASVGRPLTPGERQAVVLAYSRVPVTPEEPAAPKAARAGLGGKAAAAAPADFQAAVADIEAATGRKLTRIELAGVAEALRTPGRPF